MTLTEKIENLERKERARTKNERRKERNVARMPWKTFSAMEYAVEFYLDLVEKTIADDVNEKDSKYMNTVLNLLFTDELAGRCILGEEKRRKCQFRMGIECRRIPKPLKDLLIGFIEGNKHITIKKWQRRD